MRLKNLTFLPFLTWNLTIALSIISSIFSAYASFFVNNILKNYKASFSPFLVLAAGLFTYFLSIYTFLPAFAKQRSLKKLLSTDDEVLVKINEENHLQASKELLSFAHETVLLGKERVLEKLILDFSEIKNSSKLRSVWNEIFTALQLIETKSGQLFKIRELVVDCSGFMVTESNLELMSIVKDLYHPNSQTQSILSHVHEEDTRELDQARHELMRQFGKIIYADADDKLGCISNRNFLVTTPVGSCKISFAGDVYPKQKPSKCPLARFRTSLRASCSSRVLVPSFVSSTNRKRMAEDVTGCDGTVVWGKPSRRSL